ncbi:MAG TPA: FAD-dependent oxidoreductase [Gaiellaceae bacterium]
MQETPSEAQEVCGSRPTMRKGTRSATTTAPIQEALDAFLVELLDAPPKVTHRRAGIFGLTQNLLPLVGPVPGRDDVWVAAGYSGHGNVLGLMCGEIVAATILGNDDPLLELFAPSRLLQLDPS